MIGITKKLFLILNNKQKYFVFLLVFMMLLGGIMESMSVSMILPLITAIMDTETWNQKWYAQIVCSLFGVADHRTYIVVLLVLLVGIFVIKNIYLIWEYKIQASFIGDCRYDMQAGLIHSYIHKPYKFYLSVKYGEVIRIIDNDVTGVFNLFSHVLIFYTEIIVSIVLGVTVMTMSPTMAGGMITLLFVELIIISKILKPIMRNSGNKHRLQTSIANKWLLQALSGIKSIKVSNTEDYFETNYKKNARQNSLLLAQFQTLMGLPRLLMEACTISGVLLMMLILVLYGADMESLVPQLSAFIVAAIRLLPSANRITNSVNQVPFYEGGLDAIINVLRECDYDEKQNSILKQLNKNDCLKIPFEESIKFEKLSFSYSSDEKNNILENVDLEIAVGDSVGIIGPSGAGKTTTVDIMLGLLTPCSGSVLIDGIDIRDNLSGWLSHVAYIPQTIFLMDDTIRANVAFGVNPDEISDDIIMQAIDDAQLGDFIRNLPDGLNTCVGEQGVRLSGGQRQRIGIARALYKNPDILFFDEATSALDNETEEAIMESINHLKGRKTLIIIAHRLTTIEKCDVIYKVDNKKIYKVKG